MPVKESKLGRDTVRPLHHVKETDEPDEAYADWPGDYLPVRLPWPLDSDAKP